MRQETSNYQALRQKHQSELNAFPIGFSYTREQFEQGLVKLDCEKEDVLFLTSNSFIRQCDEAAFDALYARQEQERAEAMQDPDYLVSLFLYEMGNHEYCITCRLDDTLDACGVTKEEVDSNPLLREALRLAIREYVSGLDEQEE